MGFLRPSMKITWGWWRKAWEMCHVMLGRSAMMLGVVNVFLGIYLLSTLYGADIAAWGGTCAAGVAAIALLQNWLDRKEKHAVDNTTAQAKGLAGGAGPIGNGGIWGPAGGDTMKFTEEMLRNHDESFEGDQNDDMISEDALQVPDHSHRHPDDYHYNDPADMEGPRYR
eukprot:jgi/Chrzof1/13446/Cz07g33150.t1